MSLFLRRSRLSLLVCFCGLVAANVVTVAVGDDAVALERPIKSRSIRSPGDDVIWNCLHQNVTVELNNVPLSGIVGLLREQFPIDIQVDTSAFISEGLTGEEELSLTVTNVPLRSALNRLLKDVGGIECGYVVNNDVLLMTTKSVADDTDLMRLYKIRPFFEHGVEQTQIRQLVNFALTKPPAKGGFIGGMTTKVQMLGSEAFASSQPRPIEFLFISEQCLILNQTQSEHEKVEDVLNAYYAVVSE